MRMTVPMLVTIWAFAAGPGLGLIGGALLPDSTRDRIRAGWAWLMNDPEPPPVELAHDDRHCRVVRPGPRLFNQDDLDRSAR